jgi:hypothetical protein
MPLFMPVADQIDWTPMTAMVPGWAWPILRFAVGALIVWPRKITERKMTLERQETDAGIQSAQAAALAEIAVVKGEK